MSSAVAEFASGRVYLWISGELVECCFDDLAGALARRGVSEVIVPGEARNARLCLELLEFSTAVENVDAWVCKPESIGWSIVDQMPRYWMRRRSGEFQGYRLTGEAVPNIRLLHAGSVSGWTKSTEQALREHPAFPAYQFLCSHDEELGMPLFVELLLAIVDPRWYRNPNRTCRFNRLWRKFRLFPGEVSGDCLPCRAIREAESRCCGFFTQLLSSAEETSSPQEAMSRVAKMFVEFVCRVWMGGCGGQAAFDPHVFFARHPRGVLRYVRGWREVHESS